MPIHTRAGSYPYLIAAVTGRALAASAARGGHDAVVLDCFADSDTRSVAAACRAVRSAHGIRLDGRALLAAARAEAPGRRCAGLVYGGGFEGRTALLRRLAAGRPLCANAPAVVAQLREPRRFFPLLDRLGIAHPAVRFRAPTRLTGWLVKEPGGGGGAQVRIAGRRSPSGAYFQRFEHGRSLSALFLADGRRACVVGFSEQWAVAARPGRPFLYGGAVGGARLPASVESDLRARIDLLVSATGLVGLNGLDFLQRGEDWLALEVNPRPTATLELYDTDYPRGLFDLHLRACRGELPQRPAKPRAVRAHCVVYLAGPARAGSAFRFPRWCRDIPMPGTRFAPGDPVCTVHASASEARLALALLHRRRAIVQHALRSCAA